MSIRGPCELICLEVLCSGMTGGLQAQCPSWIRRGGVEFFEVVTCCWVAWVRGLGGLVLGGWQCQGFRRGVGE